jgi:hypothetical protein
LVFAVIRWEDANRIATMASALGAVAAVGVAVWAALPGSRAGQRASRTGKAVAKGKGSMANTGLTGLGQPAQVNRSGEARAEDGGTANTGVDSGS